MSLSAHCVERAHKRQDDSPDKRRMKQSICRQDQHDHCKKPTAPSVRKTNRPSDARSLDKHTGGLNTEKERGPAISAARRNGNHNVMIDPAEDKSQNGRAARAIPLI